MPVRWPRRPAAISEAVTAGAGPDFSCPGELEQRLKALIGEVRSLSVVCVCVSGLVVGKACGRVVDLPPWSVSSRVVCAWWGSGFSWGPKQDFLCLGASQCLFVLQVPPPGFGMCPGLVPFFGGFDSPRRALASAAAAARARRAISGPSLRSSVVLRAVPPPLGVRCALFSVFVGVGRSSGVNKIGRLFLVGLRASPPGFAFGLRLRASPSGFAFGPARSHDSAHNPWAMPGVVPGFPTKHPRHTAVVAFAAEHRRAASFWRVSCFVCCDLPRPRVTSGKWHGSRAPGLPSCRTRSARCQIGAHTVER